MTPTEIAALPPADRTQLFQQLAERRYGPKKTLELCGEEMGYGRRTVYDWVKLDTVPLPVLYALTAWETSATVAATLAALHQRP